MEWNKDILDNIQESKISNIEAKQKIAERIAKKVKNGDVIGFGSGSTSTLAIKAIAKRIKKEKLSITAIPTSYETEMLCTSLGISTAKINQVKPDWCFDGADEVDSHGWLIKGRGAAMFKEKLVISNCSERHILVDESKLVNNLCKKFPIPVECTPESLCYVKEQLLKLGATSCVLRMAEKKDGPVITECGNIILDTKFKNVDEALELKLKSITGVIETGLFIGYDVIIEK